MSILPCTISYLFWPRRVPLLRNCEYVLCSKEVPIPFALPPGSKISAGTSTFTLDLIVEHYEHRFARNENRIRMYTNVARFTIGNDTRLDPIKLLENHGWVFTP